MSLRVLYILPDFAPREGGYANACLGMAQSLLETKECSLGIIAPVPHAGPEPLGADVPVFRPPRLRKGILGSVLRNLWKSSEVRRQLKGDWDVVLFETVEYPRLIRKALRWSKVPVAARIHACSETEWVLFRPSWRYVLKRRATRKVIQELPALYSTTRTYRTFVEERFLHHDRLASAAKYTAIVPNIIPAHKVVKAHERPADDTLRLFTLGRMDRSGLVQKNLHRLLLGIARLQNRPNAPNVHLTVVGGGDTRDALIELANHLGLQDQVTWQVRVSDEELHHIMDTTSAVVLPSAFEGFSMFALEAVHNGIPLLAGNVGGLKEMVDDGVNGLLFDPEEPGEIADALLEFSGLQAKGTFDRPKLQRRFAKGPLRPEAVAQSMLSALQDTVHLHRVGLLDWRHPINRDK